MKTNLATKTLSTLSSFNSLLSDFPMLANITYDDGVESTSATIRFLFDISAMFGVTQDALLKWFSSILTDDEDNPVVKGILGTVEETMKVALLLYLKGLYTCPVDPLIPDSFLHHVLPNQDDPEWNPQEEATRGVMVPINTIDAFNVLRNCPTTERGSMFYFDVTAPEVSGQSTVYRSTDFNAWLWWIINKAPATNWYNYAWDNRNSFRKTFKNSTNGGELRKRFTDTVARSQFYGIEDVGPKKAILCARYVEANSQVPYHSNCLYVYGAAETYFHTGFGGKNKTVFDFNTNYVYSQKLFDSKTLVTQIINAVMGLATDLIGVNSLEFNIIKKKIEKTVEKIENSPISQPDNTDYFQFSEEEYAEIVNDATLSYNGQYSTKNEANDIVELDTENVVSAIRRIDSATTSTEKEEAITEAFKAVTSNTSEYSWGVNSGFVNGSEMLENFWKQLLIQTGLQLLSPKVMLLFAINNYFLNNGENDPDYSIENFIKNFWNILWQCIWKISDLLVQALYDLVIGFVRPILLLIAQKLVLETYFYYKQLLTDLLMHCVPISFNNRKSNFTIDNVNYADIIPTKTTPDK